MSTSPTTVYQIRDWDANFENNKSRGVKVCSFVCVPNKQHGLGFARVVSQPDGAALYGIWQMIIGAASRQEVRDGWLTVDGHREGAAWTPEDLALQFRRPVQEIERSLEVLSSPGVGWLVKHQVKTTRSEDAQSEPVNEAVSSKCPRSAAMVPPQCPSGILEEKGMEENRREGKGTEDPTAPPSSAAAGTSKKRVHQSSKTKNEETDPRHTDIFVLWAMAFAEHHGEPYAFSGGRDGSALKRFLPTVRDLTPQAFIDRAKEAWARYRADRFATKCGEASTIHGLCTFWNDVATQLKTPINAPPASGTRKPNNRDERGQRPGEIPTDVTADKIRRL